MMRILRAPGSPDTWGEPEALFDDTFFMNGDYGTAYDVAPIGERFLMLRLETNLSDDAGVTVIERWGQQLSHLVPRD